VIPATLVTTDADPFTTVGIPGGAGADYTPISDSLFAERRLQRFNQATTSLSGGFWNFTLQNNTFAVPFSALDYRMDGSGGTTDLSGVSSMSVDFSNVTGSTAFSWYLVDINGNFAYGPDVFVTSAQMVTFNKSTAALYGPNGEQPITFDWSQVVSMQLVVSRATGLGTSASATVSNFKATSGAPETGGNDTLNGGGGSDFLFGQAGDDLLRQQSGSDLMVGGSGADKFEYSSNSGGANFLMGTISDFAQGTDLIRLRAADFTLSANPLTPPAVVYAATVTSGNRIAYNDDTFDTTIRLHPSLNLQIQLRGFTGALTLADFVLFN
jgi:Ca2+-binding RTX toxin-like protein